VAGGHGREPWGRRDVTDSRAELFALTFVTSFDSYIFIYRGKTDECTNPVSATHRPPPFLLSYHRRADATGPTGAARAIVR
jgi:hypothetical protein